MRTDEKQYYDVPESFLKAIEEQGYKPVAVEDQTLFDPYYDAMEGHWSANSSFVNLWAWKESLPCYYKIVGELIVPVFYLRAYGYAVVGAMIGHYTDAGIGEVLRILHEDFRAMGEKFCIMDVVPWMRPYFERNGDFTYEDLRDNMDYTFTPEEFQAGMDASDDRYRYRYFLRKYNFETLEFTPEHLDDCNAFMEKYWCDRTGCEECQSGCLKQVVANIIPYYGKLRCYGIIVYVDGEPSGICLVTSRNHLGIYQYKNANNRIKGLNEYLLRETFERFMQDVDCINYTEDMGVENLRYYKEHMAPSFTLLSKLTLREKG